MSITHVKKFLLFYFIFCQLLFMVFLLPASAVPSSGYINETFSYSELSVKTRRVGPCRLEYTLINKTDKILDKPFCVTITGFDANGNEIWKAKECINSMDRYEKLLVREKLYDVKYCISYELKWEFTDLD